MSERKRRHKKRIADIIFAALTTGLLLLPFIMLDTREIVDSELENRRMTMWPGIGFNSLINEWYGHYVEDRVGLRNEAIRARADVNYLLFGEFSEDLHMNGKEGYLFPADEGYVKNYQRLNEDDELVDLLTGYADRASRYTLQNGGKFYLYICPNKSSVYGDMMPDSIHVDERRDSLLDRIRYSAMVNHVSCVIPDKELMEARNNNEYGTYAHKYDCAHWNDYGAAVGLSVLDNEINSVFSDIPVFDKNDLKFETKVLDKLEFFATDMEVKDEIPILSLPDVQIAYDSADRKDVPVVPGNNMAYFYNENAGSDRTVLILHDSFFDNKEKWYSLRYKEVYYTSRVNYTYLQEYIDIIHPDVVIFEVAERAFADDLGAYTELSSLFPESELNYIMMSDSVPRDQALEEPVIITDATGINEEKEEDKPIVVADEKKEEYLPLLSGKKVALFSNKSGVLYDEGQKKHVLDVLVENGVDVTSVFAPEHGFRGDASAGESVSDSKDEKTGVPIRSLYGDGKAGALSTGLNDADILVVDIQDVGVRYYTYYLTMMELMEGCAKRDIPVVILDRPNPNGSYVDGPILRSEFKSGVGKIPIPVVHGMTLGELALMINGEGWLSSGADSCDITVIKCDNYDHEKRYDLQVDPSPNLRSMRAIYLYPSLCYFENTVVSVGRGTDNPFEIYGSPYLEGVEGYQYAFNPKSNEGAKNPPYEGQYCYGRELTTADIDEILDEKIDLSYLVDAYNAVKDAHPDVSFFGKADGKGQYWIDKLMGTDQVRKMILEGKSTSEIEDSWLSEAREFKEQRAKYLLYD